VTTYAIAVHDEIYSCKHGVSGTSEIHGCILLCRPKLRIGKRLCGDHAVMVWLPSPLQETSALAQFLHVDCVELQREAPPAGPKAFAVAVETSDIAHRSQFVATPRR
jgi:hypothetical protein